MTDPATSASAALTLDVTHTVPADITVEVIDRAHDDRTFVCTVTSPWLDDFKAKREEPWELGSTAAELGRAYMQQFTAKGVAPGSRLLALNGAGVNLWKVAPARFKEAVAALGGTRAY